MRTEGHDEKCEMGTWFGDRKEVTKHGTGCRNGDDKRQDDNVLTLCNISHGLHLVGYCVEGWVIQGIHPTYPWR